MTKNPRHEQIVSILRENKEVSVKELCALLYLSPATVRRDLTALERQGILKRSFGGAVLVEAFSDQLPLSIRSAKNITQKKKLCERAASYVEDGDTLFVDASTTTYFLPLYLKNKNDITVITNSPSLCLLLSELKIRSICTGGEMLTGSVALAGVDALLSIDGMHADKMFFSARGYDLKSGAISDSSKGERDVKIAMLKNSDRSYFLCDSSKYGEVYAYKIIHGDRVSKIITDSLDITNS